MESDTTWVTGGAGGRAPRKGDVLGERYEIAEALDSDSLVRTYRGVDQETEAAILVRATPPALLGVPDARKVVERIHPLIGAGGRILSPLLDVDREGTTVFTVEPWPRGTSLRAVLDARRAKGVLLEPREVLPVLARLAAALGSIADAYAHGDVRPERVFIDPDGLVLTGGFLLAAVPAEAIAKVLEDDALVRRCFAPEVGEGLASRASDRWGAAAIVWEALVGTAPGASSFPGASSSSSASSLSAPSTLGPVAPALARALATDPASRPATLDQLIAAVAELARLPVPRVELDSFPSPALRATIDEPTQPSASASASSSSSSSGARGAARGTEPQLAAASPAVARPTSPRVAPLGAFGSARPGADRPSAMPRAAAAPPVGARPVSVPPPSALPSIAVPSGSTTSPISPARPPPRQAPAPTDTIETLLDDLETSTVVRPYKADLAREISERELADGEPPTKEIVAPPRDVSATSGASSPGPSSGKTAASSSARSSDRSPDATTAPHSALGADGSVQRGEELDPRLVRAALAPEEMSLSSSELELAAGATDPMDADPGRTTEDLDPRLVRAALGVSLEDSDSIETIAPRDAGITQEIRTDDLVPLSGATLLDIVPPAAMATRPAAIASAAGARATGAKGERGVGAASSAPRASAARPAPSAAGAAAPASAAKPAAGPRSSPAPSNGGAGGGGKASSPASARAAPAGGRASRRQRPLEPVPIPQEIKPIPRPRRDSGEMSVGPVLFDASRPAPRAPAPVAIVHAPKPAIERPALRAAATDPARAADHRPDPRVERATPSRSASGVPAWASWAIVVLALVVAGLIVATGFWLRAELQRDHERNELNQQRLREIRGGAPP
jgi:hypothetical protein